MIIRHLLPRRALLATPQLRPFTTTRTLLQTPAAPPSPDASTPPPTTTTTTTPDTPDLSAAERFTQQAQFKRTSGHLGTTLQPHYRPHTLITSPPSPREITLELLLASQAHIGHATSLWNPANQRYLFGVRQGVHIFSLEAIAAHLRRAAKIVSGVTEQGGLVLFVGTRAGQDRAVVSAARRAGGCHLFERWTPGAITNGQQIVGHGKVVRVDLRERRAAEAEKAPDAVRPDLVVCLNPLENYVLLQECGLYAIPTIGIIDSDADPSWVTYPIPGNDDSLRAVQLIAGILGRAGEEGRNRRIRRAEQEAAIKAAREIAEEMSKF